MKYLKKYPLKFKKRIDVPDALGPKTRDMLANSCLEDLYVTPCTLNMSSQNPAIMIPRIFNTLPISVKNMRENSDFICKIRQVVLKYQYYDMNEFFICNFDLINDM